MGGRKANDRIVIGLMSLAYDGLMCAVAVVVGLLLDSEIHGGTTVRAGIAHLDWSSVVIPVAVIVAFGAHGLYTKEAYVSRWVPAWMLSRSLVTAAVVTAAVLWATHASASSLAYGSRFTTLLTFAILVVLAGATRVLLLGRVALRIMGTQSVTLLVGQTPALEPLRRRLEYLRGFNKLIVLEVNGFGTEELAARVATLLDAPTERDESIRNVFINADSMPPDGVLTLSELAKKRGREVYVASALMRGLASRRLLPELFQTPVARIRRSLHDQVSSGAKRVFDVAVAGTAMVVLSLLFAGIALAVKLSSPGPVFYAQERVGRHGTTFRFYKFRSMDTSNDASAHRDYVHGFIQNGSAGLKAGNATGNPVVFKISADPRVTRVGRFLRKYSLDELPQLWNVLKGDMSLIGPRPALPYEVEVYEDWHKLRLLPQPGVSGLWQVQGRSRVTFDEMVLQDVVYACNRTLLTDCVICLRTIPAAVLGRGAA